MGPVFIHTARLNLRAWTSDDADDLLRLAADTEVMRYISGGVARSREEVLEFIERQMTAQAERGWCRWALELRTPAENDPAGAIGFCGPGCTFAPDVEVGWWLLRSLWDRGLATEAGRAAVDYCFGVVGFDHLICMVHRDNARSLKVAGKVGFVPVREVVHEGLPIIQHELINPLDHPPRDPRFTRNCDGAESSPQHPEGT